MPWNSRPAHFARHYVEMVVAMFAGMLLLGIPLAALLGVIGIEVSDWRTDAPALMLLGMAFTMSVPMAGWMWFRGHGTAPIWEMTAAMLVPSFAAIALLAAGIASDHGALMAIQHIGMFAAMLAVMLLRLDEYAGHAQTLA